MFLYTVQPLDAQATHLPGDCTVWVPFLLQCLAFHHFLFRTVLIVALAIQSVFSVPQVDFLFSVLKWLAFLLQMALSTNLRHES